MHLDLLVANSFCGAPTMNIAGCPVVPSLISDRLTHWLRVKYVEFLNVAISATALLCFLPNKIYPVLLEGNSIRIGCRRSRCCVE